MGWGKERGREGEREREREGEREGRTWNTNTCMKMKGKKKIIAPSEFASIMLHNKYTSFLNKA